MFFNVLACVLSVSALAYAFFALSATFRREGGDRVRFQPRVFVIRVTLVAMMAYSGVLAFMEAKWMLAVTNAAAKPALVFPWGAFDCFTAAVVIALVFIVQKNLQGERDG